jgi:hypothetical protein
MGRIKTIDACTGQVIQEFSPPASAHPDSAATAAVPMRPQPNGATMRRQRPSARKPDPRRAVPIPISSRPNKIRSWRGNDHFWLRFGLGRRGCDGAIRRFSGGWWHLRSARRGRGGHWGRLWNVNSFHTAANGKSSGNNDDREMAQILFHVLELNPTIFLIDIQSDGFVQATFRRRDADGRGSGRLPFPKSRDWGCD